MKRRRRKKRWKDIEVIIEKLGIDRERERGKRGGRGDKK